MITGVQSQGEKKHTWKRSSAVKALDFICEQAVLTLALLMEDRASFLFLFPAMQLAFTAAAWEAVTEHRPGILIVWPQWIVKAPTQPFSTDEYLLLRTVHTLQGLPGQMLEAAENQPSCRSNHSPCWFGRGYGCMSRHPQNRQLVLVPNLTHRDIFSRCAWGKGLIIVKSVFPCTGTWAAGCETGFTVLIPNDI